MQERNNTKLSYILELFGWTWVINYLIKNFFNRRLFRLHVLQNFPQENQRELIARSKDANFLHVELTLLTQHF